MISGLFLALLALAGGADPVSSANRLPPIDQCEAVPGFAVFRNSLLNVIKRHDAAALLSVLSDDVLATFGAGGEGKQEFIATWNLVTPQTSGLWDQLGKALALGCAHSGDALVAPSMIAQIDPMIDGFKTVITVESDASLREAPREDAHVLTKMNWDILTVDDTEAGDDWLAVALTNGQKGFVRRDQVRSVIDYRAVFEQRDGRWLMTAFVGGD